MKALLGDGKGKLQITDKSALANIQPPAKLYYARFVGKPKKVIQVISIHEIPLIEGLVVEVVRDTLGNYALIDFTS